MFFSLVRLILENHIHFKKIIHQVHPEFVLNIIYIIYIQNIKN